MVGLMLQRITINSLQPNCGLHSHQQTNCTLPKTRLHSAAKQLVCPLYWLDMVWTIWTLSSCEERYRASISQPVNTILLLMTYQWNTLINWYDWLSGEVYKMWYVLNIRTKFHAVVNQSVTVRNHTFHAWYCTLGKKKNKYAGVHTYTTQNSNAW
jgi:hypothetical protein